MRITKDAKQHFCVEMNGRERRARYFPLSFWKPRRAASHASGAGTGCGARRKLLRYNSFQKKQSTLKVRSRPSPVSEEEDKHLGGLQARRAGGQSGSRKQGAHGLPKGSVTTIGSSGDAPRPWLQKRPRRSSHKSLTGLGWREVEGHSHSKPSSPNCVNSENHRN